MLLHCWWWTCYAIALPDRSAPVLSRAMFNFQVNILKTGPGPGFRLCLFVFLTPFSILFIFFHIKIQSKWTTMWLSMGSPFLFKKIEEARVVQGTARHECVPLIIRPSAVGNTPCSLQPTVTCCGHTSPQFRNKTPFLWFCRTSVAGRYSSAQRIPGQALRLDR